VGDESGRMTPEEFDRMMREITMGVPREQSQAPITAETTKHWNTLTEQITEIKAAGMIVEIPFDI